jgi:hypothetical protein
VPEIELTVWRGGQERPLTVHLAEMPRTADNGDDAPARAGAEGGFGLAVAPADGRRGGDGVEVMSVDPDGAAIVSAVIATPIVACLGLLGVADGCGLRVGGRGFTPASLAVFRVGGFATPLACAASLLLYGFVSRYPGPIGLAILGIPTVCGLGTALMAMRRR